jgi:hypothetical protein
MADALAAGTALEKVPETEVLVGEIDSTMSDLMLAARQAENLKPLTEEEANGMTVAQLGDRAALIFSHYKCTLMSERDFILKFRVELNVLRRKTTQQGRRLPIPGCPTWGEVKKTYFKLSGRQIDALLADPKPDKKEPEPEPAEDREITVSDDQPETPTPGEEPEILEPDQPLPVTDVEVARIHEAAAADTLPDIEDEVAASAEREPSGWGKVVSRNLAQGLVTPEVVARFLNDTYAEKPGRHEAVRQMLGLLDKCILWDIRCEAEAECSSRQGGSETTGAHPSPSEAAEEVLRRGGFWSAKALFDEADIHLSHFEYIQNGMSTTFCNFKKNVLGNMRRGDRLKTRMLGRVYWYCHPDNEAALKAAKKPHSPEFHRAEGEILKGAAPQPPLVEPRAARRGQDAEDANHLLSSVSGKGDSAAPNAPPAAPAAAPTEDEPQPESATAKKPGGAYLPPIWMEDGRHGHVVGGLSRGAMNFQVRLTTRETVKVPKDGYVDMGGCENRAEVLGQDFMERRFMPDAWLNDANGAYDIAMERVPPEALEFLRVLGDKPAA